MKAIILWLWLVIIDYRMQVSHLKTSDCKRNRLDKTLSDRFPNVQNYDIPFHEAENLNIQKVEFQRLEIFWCN